MDSNNTNRKTYKNITEILNLYDEPFSLIQQKTQ